VKVKGLNGTFGLGLVYHKATHSLMISFCDFGLVISFPVVGACKTAMCGHGPDQHAATREYGMIEWSCHGENGTCGCENYEPVRKTS
jgi:hypothetical protein